jgi:drug/metabolite transporter (DMT)-like permease
LFLHTQSLYYLLSKRLLATYPPLCVAGWAYGPAALLMGATAALSAPPESWHLPTALYGPLAYWVLVCSVAGYAAVAWAASRLPASQVAAFTVLQPFLGTALAAGFLGERLSPWDAGAVPVLAGLALVIRADGSAGAGGAGGLGRTASGLGGAASHLKQPPPSPVLPAPPRPAPAAASVKGGVGAWLWGRSKPAVA